MRHTLTAVAAIGAAATLTFTLAPTADAATKPIKYKNCAALNKVYKHGVGKPGTKDKVASGKKPVTNFTKSTKVYNLNKHLDRDKDKIACEKR
jgi:hypothetical protein